MTTLPPVLSRRTRARSRLATRALAARRAHPLTPVVVLVLTYAGVTRALVPVLGLRWGQSRATLAGMVLVCLLPLLVAIVGTAAIAAARALRQRTDVVRTVSAAVSDRLRATGGHALIVAVCSGLMLHASTTWRSSLATLAPFWADPALHRLDSTLHGGVPWEHLAALFAVPGAVNTLVWAYERLWFLGAIMVAPLAALAPIGPRAQRVLLTHALTYIILATVLAPLVSSAGPVYYGRVVGWPDPYAALVVLLDVHAGGPLGPRAAHEYLWGHHVAGTASLATGITAFPSMHLATATLLALAAGAWRRWAGVLGWLLVVVMLVGSVLLAWHYAVDGYAGIAGTCALWWAVGRWQRRVRGAHDGPGGPSPLGQR